MSADRLGSVCGHRCGRAVGACGERGFTRARVKQGRAGCFEDVEGLLRPPVSCLEFVRGGRLSGPCSSVNTPVKVDLFASVAALPPRGIPEASLPPRVFFPVCHAGRGESGINLACRFRRRCSAFSARFRQGIRHECKGWLRVRSV